MSAKEGKKTMPRNTTRGTGNAIADPRAGVKREVMELYHRLRHFTRPRQRVRVRDPVERCVVGPDPADKPTIPRIIDQFRADSRPEIVFSIVEVAPGDRVLSVEKSMAAGIVGTLLLRPGEKGFPSHERQILTGIMTFRRQSFRVINSSCNSCCVGEII